MFLEKITLFFIFMIIFNIIIKNNYVNGLRLNPGFSNTEVEWIHLQEYSNEYSPGKTMSNIDKKYYTAEELKRGFIRRSLNYGVMLFLIVFF